jgi:hypothetical protein
LKFFYLLFSILLVFYFTNNRLLADEIERREKLIAELSSYWALANSYFEKKDYYRSVSELYRLKFYYDQDSYFLENLLAKNYYSMKDYPKLISLADKKTGDKKDSEALGLISLAYLQSGNIENAKSYWELAGIEEEFYKPEGQNLLNPEKAFWLSLFPGAGFAYTRNYGMAIASFLLNSVFFYGIIKTFEQEQYATSYLLFFFEYQFYLGGMRAAREQAKVYNQEISEKEQKLFIQLFEKKFGVTSE